MRRIFLVVALSLSSLGAAADKKATARKHYQEGQKLYNLGKFAEAIGEFERGYDSFSDPAFLFNLGQCHRLLGNGDRAIFYYRGYLREKPDAVNRADVERIIAELENAKRPDVPPPVPVIPTDDGAGQQAQPQPEPSPEPQPAEAPPPEPMREEPTPAASPAPVAAEQRPSAAPEAAVTAAEPESPRKKSSARIWAWSTVGLGVALVAVGTVFGLQARGAASDANSCIEAGQPWPDCQDAIDRHDSKKGMAMVMIGIGSAAAVGGGIWALLASRD